MARATIWFFILLLAACASFDRTNIRPGDRVFGPGYSFEVPTEQAWFASEYGTGHRMKLNQINGDDSYSILVSLNRGPMRGMYPSAEAHLAVFEKYYQRRLPRGFRVQQHEANADARYGELCIRYLISGEDWTGRNKRGPALVDTIGLTCAHPEIANVLVNFELSRRYEEAAEPIELASFADSLFASIEYRSLN